MLFDPKSLNRIEIKVFVFSSRFCIEKLWVWLDRLHSETSFNSSHTHTTKYEQTKNCLHASNELHNGNMVYHGWV